MQWPDDVVLKIIDYVKKDSGLRAGKELRKKARVSHLFADAARAHPDNNIPNAATLIAQFGAALVSDDED